MSTPMTSVADLLESTEGRTIAPYREAMGRLQYLASASRPDLLFATNMLSRFNDKATDKHWSAAKRAKKYASTTSGYKLNYKPNKQKRITIKAFSDAAFANDATTRHSQGNILYVNKWALCGHKRQRGYSRK